MKKRRKASALPGIELLEHRRLLTGDGTFLPLASVQPIPTQDLFSEQNASAQHALFSDLDNDGADDYVMITNSSRLEIRFFASSNELADSNKLRVPGNYAEDIVQGDINGDGFTDIVVAGATSIISYVNQGLSNEGTWLGMTQGQLISDVSSSIALSDFNGDGHDDLVAATEKAIDVRFANADGQFDDAVRYLEGAGRKAVTSGDINNDGRADIVASLDTSETAIVLVNDGEGFFEEGQTLADVESNRLMKLMDVNSDGQLDLVAGAFGHFEFTTGPTLFVWQADEAGVLADHPVGYETIGSPLDYVMGDINGDGIEDMFVGHTSTFHHPTNGNGPGGISVLLATSPGQFQAPVRISTPGGVSVKINETPSGQELTAIRSWSGEITRYKWKSDPAIQTAYDFGVSSSNAFVRKESSFGDFNGDGTLDTVTINYSVNPPALDVYVSNAAGQYDIMPLELPADTHVQAVVTGDFNGDGLPDIGVDTATSVGSFLSNADGTFANFVRSTSLRAAFNLPTVADVNGDGLDDLIGLESDKSSYLVRAIANGDGTWDRQSDRVQLNSPWVSQLKIQDLNGDGFQDVFITSGSAVEVILGNTEGFDTPLELTMQTSATAIGDLNGDGFDDIMGFGFEFGGGEPILQHKVAYGRADGFDRPLTIEIDERIQNVEAIQAVDLDGDGTDEIAVFSREALFVLRGDTNTEFSTQLHTEVGFPASDVVVGDVTGDQIPDLTLSPSINLIFGSAAMTVGVLEGNADGEFEQVTMVSAPFVDGSVAAVVPSTKGVEFFVNHRFGFGKFVAEFPGSTTNGDFDGSGAIDVGDIDLLCSASHNGSLTEEEIARFDQNSDKQIDASDVESWIADVAQTRQGDTDIDGDVDFADFLKLSSRFGATDALWSDGDFNCDGEVSFADFLLLSANFGTG